MFYFSVFYEFISHKVAEVALELLYQLKGLWHFLYASLVFAPLVASHLAKLVVCVVAFVALEPFWLQSELSVALFGVLQHPLWTILGDVVTLLAFVTLGLSASLLWR